MIIEKIEIGSFGKLDNMTLELSEGVNIIRGANESGKSTICSFICFIFYGLPSSDKTKYISWNTSSCRGTITFKNDDGIRYRAEREVICTTNADGRTQYRERAVVYNAETNELVFKGPQIGEHFFGVPENVFNSTVYIRQLDGTKIGDKALCESAENILFSGDEGINTKKALKKLDDARVFLLYKNKKGGKIYDLEYEIGEIEKKLDEAQKSGTDIIYLEGTARQLDEKRTLAEVRSNDMKRDLDTYEEYMVKKAYLKYKDELRKSKEIKEKIDKIRFAEDFGNAPVYSDEYIEKLEGMKRSLEMAAVRLEESALRFENAKKRVFDMSEKIEVFERFGKKSKERDNLIAGAETIHEKVRGLSIIRKAALACGGIFVVALLIMAILNIVGVMENGGYMAIPGIFCLLSLAAFIAVSVLISKPAAELRKICGTFGCSSYAELDELVKAASNDEAVMTYIIDEKDAAEGAYASASDKLDLINSEILTELEASKFTIEKNTALSLEEAIKICREKKAELDKINVIKNASDARIAEIEKDLGSHEESYIKHACLREYDEEAMEAFDYQARRRDYDFVMGSIKSQTEKIHEIEKELAALSAVTVRPTEIAEIRTAALSELEKLTNKYNAYLLAHEAMTEASGKLREGLAPKIAKEASAIMNKLSAGKYQSLGVGADFDMTFRDSSMTHNVSSLSAGTSDIAYISLRIALIDVLFRKSVPPFIFDESFMRMDNDRMTNSLKLLCDIGNSGAQSLLFTCHGREEKLMKTIGEYTYFTI